MSRHRRISPEEQALRYAAAQKGERRLRVVPDPPGEFDRVPERAFGGETYEPPRDGSRLRAQLVRVKAAMGDAEWRTLGEIASITGDPEASVSARLRDLRKAKFGGHLVDRKYSGGGLWCYKLRLRERLDA